MTGDYTMTMFNITISTHTLTWSVTLSECLNAGEEVISTHTLTWSVTTSITTGKTTFDISTHTLTWSVTVANPILGNKIVFQLTRSRGA